MAGTLSFDHSLLWTADTTSGASWPDNFTATLWDVGANAPLLNISGHDEYFYRDTQGLVDDSVVSLVGGNVRLDVSSIAPGTTVRLSFDLWYDSLAARQGGLYCNPGGFELRAEVGPFCSPITIPRPPGRG